MLILALLKDLLNSSEEDIVFKSAKLLTHWGQTSGFDALVSLLDGYIDHRLYSIVDDWEDAMKRLHSTIRSRYNRIH